MNSYGVLVVGGGAAGLAAAMVLLRARRTVAVVDAGSPRNAPAARMHGFLSRDGMPPAELLAAGRAEVSGYGGVLLDDTVVSIAPGFLARLADGTELRARRVLVAAGLRDETPDIPGIGDRWGRDALHCPYCHGYEVRDRPLGVLGGSPEAVQHALLIRQWFTPNSRLLTDLGCEADENGWVTAEAAGRTTVPGVRVAGNAADPRARVITAAGQGSAAAIAINAELVGEDVEDALTAYRAAG